LSLHYFFMGFVIREWLLVISGIGLVLSSIYTGELPDYSAQELQVLYILLVLFITVRGLQNSGLILRFSRSIETGRGIPLKLLVFTFFLSMIVTNDVALIVMVPITLALNINRKGIVVIFEALAANAGSAFTPFGNPQNLYIYWYYDLSPVDFISSIAPFSMVFLLLLAVSAGFIKTEVKLPEITTIPVNKRQALIYGFLFVVVMLTILHVLPILSGLAVLVFALLFDRPALKVDYALLLTFVFFFGLADDLKLILAADMNHSGNIFILSALSSQFISNVPATLLFAKFTSNWEALLWGVNAGGFGTLFGSLANLIAYKLYITHTSSDHKAQFTAQFMFFGFAALFISTALYFMLY